MRRFLHQGGHRPLLVVSCDAASLPRAEKISVSPSSPIPLFSAFSYYSSASFASYSPCDKHRPLIISAGSFSSTRLFSNKVSLLSTTSSAAGVSVWTPFCRPSRSISYAAGLFHDRLSCEEVYPFPARHFPGEGVEGPKKEGKRRNKNKNSGKGQEGGEEDARSTATDAEDIVQEEEEGENLVMLLRQITAEGGNLNSEGPKCEAESRKEEKTESAGEEDQSCRVYYGARIPTEYGGLGLGNTAYAYVCEEAGRAGKVKEVGKGSSPNNNSSCRSDTDTSNDHKVEFNPMLCTLHSASLAVFLLSTWGSKEMKGQHLTQLSDGSEVFGWAVQEPHGGHPDLSMNTTVARLGQSTTTTTAGSSGGGDAEKKVEGEEEKMDISHAEVDPNAFYITGEKLCPLASTATHFLVLAKTPTQVDTPSGPLTSKRSTFFLVSKDTPGVEVVPSFCSSSATSPSDYSLQRVIFRNAKAEDVVGNAGEGFRMQLVSIMTEQFGWAAALLGTLKSMYQEVEELAKVMSRKAGEEADAASPSSLSCSSSSSHQALMGFALAILYAMESSLYAVTANMDRKARDTLLELCFTTGFIQHHSLLLLETLTSCSVGGGAIAPEAFKHISCYTSTIHTLLSSLPPLDYLRAIAISSGAEEFGLQFQATSTVSVMQKRILRSVGMREKLPIEGVDCRPLDAALLQFSKAVERVFLRHTTALPHQQVLLQRLGEAGELAYVATTAASRASLALQKGVPTSKMEKWLAESFLEDASRRIGELCELCCHSGKTADDLTKRIALQLCDRAARRAHE